MDKIYCQLPVFDDDAIKQILQFGTIEEKMTLSLSVGEYHSDWEYAQQICARLASHDNQKVKANAALGFGYIARTKGKLQQSIVEPILQRLLDECTDEDMCKGRVADAIDDVNVFMGWSITSSAQLGL